MKIEKALSLVVGEYNQCKNNPVIRKPVSYALYQAWKWCDRNEKENPPFSCEFCKYLGNPNYCPDKNGQMDLSDYCSWGELKDEGDDGQV